MSRLPMLTCTHDASALRAVLKSDFDTLSGDISSAPHISAIIEHLLQTTVVIARDLVREWNASKSGTFLPVEILANVLKFLPLLDRISASHVSHHWRQSALAFSELWTHIDITQGRLESVYLIELALSRSGRLPVVISYKLGANPAGAVTMAYVLQTVQHSRLQDVGLDMHNVLTDAVLSLFKLFTANAVELRVIRHPGDDDGLALTIHKGPGLIRRLWFTNVTPGPLGRGPADTRETVRRVLCETPLDGLHSLSIDGTLLSTTSPTELPGGIRRLTIHLRHLDRPDDPDQSPEALMWRLMWPMTPWQTLDTLPRLVTPMRAPVHVRLEIHDSGLCAEDAQRLLAKIASLELSHLPPLRIQGFPADVVSTVSKHRAVASGRVVFEM